MRKPKPKTKRQRARQKEFMRYGYRAVRYFNFSRADLDGIAKAIGPTRTLDMLIDAGKLIWWPE